jgi:phosphoglycerate dehydrogenase-like enzyme
LESKTRLTSFLICDKLWTQLPEGLIAVEPKSGRFESLEQAVIEAGGQVVGLADAEALVWADPGQAEAMGSTLAANKHLDWVALPFAGVEDYLRFLDEDRVWTAAKGVYAKPVAEHALALGLAGLRNLVGYSRAKSWSSPVGHNLIGGRVVVFGAGGITEELLPMLHALDCHVTVIRRSADPMPGADRTVGLEDRLRALAEADLVVLALALTPETQSIISAPELHAMPRHSWLINVARGGHVNTEALADCLASGGIGGAALDVTNPEPLPADHRLWSEPRALITPHVANTPEMGIPLLAARVKINVRRFINGQPLVGIVDVRSGY